MFSSEAYKSIINHLVPAIRAVALKHPVARDRAALARAAERVEKASDIDFRDSLIRAVEAAEAASFETGENLDPEENVPPVYGACRMLRVAATAAADAVRAAREGDEVQDSYPEDAAGHAKSARRYLDNMVRASAEILAG